MRRRTPPAIRSRRALAGVAAVAAMLLLAGCTGGGTAPTDPDASVTAAPGETSAGSPQGSAGTTAATDAATPDASRPPHPIALPIVESPEGGCSGTVTSFSSRVDWVEAPGGQDLLLESTGDNPWSAALMAMCSSRDSYLAASPSNTWDVDAIAASMFTCIHIETLDIPERETRFCSDTSQGTVYYLPISAVSLDEETIVFLSGAVSCMTCGDAAAPPAGFDPYVDAVTEAIRYASIRID